jgi:hypothetical protein
MDQNTTTAIAYSGFVISLAGSIYAAVNHKRVRSNCCGAKIEASFDVETTTPPNAAPAPISIPHV